MTTEDSAASRTRRDRIEIGRALREHTPRSSHADWSRAADRTDPLKVLETQAATRVPELVPLRYGRMAQSPFAFLRGAAAVMAMDLATTPRTGLTVQTCGDAHISNFGEFATPERNVVFDLNDFDETLPGPWEWDVKRFTASLAVVCRQRGFRPDRSRVLLTTAVRTYRTQIAAYAELRLLDRWYAQIGIDEVVSHFPSEYRSLVRRDVQKARAKTHQRAVTKLTAEVDGKRRFVENPPLLVHLERTGHEMDEVGGTIEGYRSSLDDERRALFDQFTLVDVARKVVGVGSVGTRCWVGLLEGPAHAEGDFLILQLKEASASVLEPYLGPSKIAHHGRRVVTGQRMIQAASDIFLGWSTGPKTARHYYGRQLWDVKGQGDPLAMDEQNLCRYGELCAWALARAHARTGDPVVMSGYLGTSGTFDQAIAEFAVRYADQTERDYAALTAAIAAGDITAVAAPG